MLSKTITILECSRVFSLPMTIFSWLVVFSYSVINFGNVLYGFVALIGLCFVHLGTNLVDDYFDYKSLLKRVDFDKAEYLKNSQKTKCRYLISGVMSEAKVLLTSAIYFSVAMFLGLFLYLKCGVGVVYFGLVGAFIALLYPFLSRICLSELAVAIAYGPALFGGVYYVMTGAFSLEVFILSLPTTFMTIVLLYIHTLMDYDFDLAEGKCTVANRFRSKAKALVLLKYFLFLAYFSIIFLCIFDIVNWQVLLTYFTIPMAIDLYKSLSNYVVDSDIVPERKWYHFPMENYERFRKYGELSFMFRIFQARNLMMYFSVVLILLITISLIL